MLTQFRALETDSWMPSVVLGKEPGGVEFTAGLGERGALPLGQLPAKPVHKNKNPLQVSFGYQKEVLTEAFCRFLHV